MIRIMLGLGRFDLVLLPLGETLAVAVEAEGDGQGKDLRASPEGMDDDQAEDDPVVSPTDQGFGPARDERIIMHAGTVEGQSTFAAEGVVDGPDESSPWSENRDDELGKVHGECVEIPGGVTEEAME